MSRIVFIVVFLPLAALAKPWNGIEPGKSTGAAVTARFGEPSKKLEARGQTVLVYTRDRAIKGTVQAQFKLNSGTQVVERIDVYPEPIIDLVAIEASYGPACVPETPADPCYHRREAGGKKSYLLYLKLGLAIFFKPDGRTVQSFAFLPGKH